MRGTNLWKKRHSGKEDIAEHPKPRQCKISLCQTKQVIVANTGRLNVLANVVRKPMRRIFSEFSGMMPTSEGTGDVKYHLGTSYDRPTISGKRVHLSLLANPSHLEVCSPFFMELHGIADAR